MDATQTHQPQRQHHQHPHHHRPLKLSVPPRLPYSRPYPLPSYSYSAAPTPYPSTPVPTPSKPRHSTRGRSSASSLFLLLFSLRSLYSLLPFLRSSSPSFSLFPFSFLVSLLSSLITLSVYKSTPPLPPPPMPSRPLSPSLLLKSSLLALVFLLRFQALRSCGTSATILAEFSGNAAANFAALARSRLAPNLPRAARGLAALALGFSLLSLGWDRSPCFPLLAAHGCPRILPMLLPFLAGFLGFYERASSNWPSLRPLGRKRVRLSSLFLTTALLFLPAAVSFLAVEEERVPLKSLGWPLLNTVVFGVILSENYGDDKAVYARGLQKNFLVTFLCTLVLELFYFPELSLPGFALCGLLLWFSVKELGSDSLYYPELGSDSSEKFSSVVLKPIRHILSERKSRKIALFLLINTAYMFVEFIVGFMSNSLGLISDACHMLFDCAALAIGLYASYISRLPATHQFNYGRGRFEVLSGYVNAVLLVLVGALIVLESFERIFDPQEISTNSLLSVSIGGLVVNVVGLIFFHEEHHHAHGSCSHLHGHHHKHGHSHNHGGHHHDHHQSTPISHEATHGKLSTGHDSHDHEHHHHLEGDLTGPAKELAANSLHNHDHHQGNFHGKDEKKLGNHPCDHYHDHHHDNYHDHHNHDLNNNHVHQGTHHCDDCEHNHHGYTHDVLPGSSGVDHSHRNSISSSGDSCGVYTHGGTPVLQNSSCCHGKQEISSHVSNLHIETGSHSDLSETKGDKKHQKHRHVDHNMEGIFLHVLADTLGSVGVVIATLLIEYKGWLIADPACSIFISVLIISSVIPLLRNTAEILLQRVPRIHEHDLDSALDEVRRIKGVHGVEKMHVWSFTNTDVVGTLHVHISSEIDKSSFRKQVTHLLRDAGVNDLTLQVECERGQTIATKQL